MAYCELCNQFSVKAGRDPWNEPLIASEHFMVIPSLGALVEGWVLIVPKEHYISMGALPTELQKEFDEIELKARHVLKTSYQKPIVAFEHGPSAAKHGTGCGVDHAHLHLVPTDCDLFSYVRPFVSPSLEWKICTRECLAAAYSAGMDYLFLQHEGEAPLMATAQDFGSQVFRKALSSFLGMENQFSWREYPRYAIVKQTILTLTNMRDEKILSESEYVA
jgi:ATP adenylyltransferase